jgi:hypothetical protein
MPRDGATILSDVRQQTLELNRLARGSGEAGGSIALGRSPQMS